MMAQSYLALSTKGRLTMVQQSEYHYLELSTMDLTTMASTWAG
jgi:hypothetical protein